MSTVGDATGNRTERKGPPPPTIKDVAALAGVSVTTVSHVINEKGRVGAETREKVLEAIGTLEYNPSRAARALRTNRTGTLAFLVPFFEAPAAIDGRLTSLDLYMTEATAAAQAAFARDHALLLLPPTVKANDLRGLGVDGGIVCDPLENDPLVALFGELELPTVTIECDPGHPDDPWYVGADNAASTRTLLDHLLAEGAERIAFLGVDLPIAWARQCCEEYERWMRDRGLEPVTGLINPHDHSRTAYSMASTLLDATRPPDAIFAADERFPSGVLRAAGERGLEVPRDLMIATGIDSHEARQAVPPITAIDIHPALQGALAVELLVNRLEGIETDAPRTTPTTLNTRASTARLSGASS